MRWRRRESGVSVLCQCGLRCRCRPRCAGIRASYNLLLLVYKRLNKTWAKRIPRSVDSFPPLLNLASLTSPDSAPRTSPRPTAHPPTTTRPPTPTAMCAWRATLHGSGSAAARSLGAPHRAREPWRSSSAAVRAFDSRCPFRPTGALQARRGDGTRLRPLQPFRIRRVPPSRPSPMSLPFDFEPVAPRVVAEGLPHTAAAPRTSGGARRSGRRMKRRRAQPDSSRGALEVESRAAHDGATPAASPTTSATCSVRGPIHMASRRLRAHGPPPSSLGAA